MRRDLIVLSLILLTALTASAQSDPTTQRTVIDANDKDAITKNIGQTVIVVGKIKAARWSQSGKVMNIEFENTDDSKLLAVIFDDDRKKMDEAFAGDVAKALEGASVRILGKLQEYGGKTPEFMGRPQMIIEFTTQITIIEPAKTQ